MNEENKRENIREEIERAHEATKAADLAFLSLFIFCLGVEKFCRKILEQLKSQF